MINSIKKIKRGGGMHEGEVLESSIWGTYKGSFLSSSSLQGQVNRRTGGTVLDQGRVTHRDGAASKEKGVW